MERKCVCQCDFNTFDPHSQRIFIWIILINTEQSTVLNESKNRTPLHNISKIIIWKPNSFKRTHHFGLWSLQFWCILCRNLVNECYQKLKLRPKINLEVIHFDSHFLPIKTLIFCWTDRKMSISAHDMPFHLIHVCISISTSQKVNLHEIFEISEEIVIIMVRYSHWKIVCVFATHRKLKDVRHHWGNGISLFFSFSLFLMLSFVIGIWFNDQHSYTKYNTDIPLAITSTSISVC